MGEGDEALFEVPPEHLFGDRASGSLPPNSVTIWRMRLVRVFKKPEFPTSDPEGFSQLPSGLRYRFLKQGHGRQPGLQDRVKLHFTGWLEDGREVATTYRARRQEPQSLEVSQAIRGLALALQLSREGSVIEVLVPYHLGYGEKGSMPLVPPSTNLVYIVELVQVM